MTPTTELLALVDRCVVMVTSVVTESTGVFWWAVWNTLDGRDVAYADIIASLHFAVADDGSPIPISSPGPGVLDVTLRPSAPYGSPRPAPPEYDRVF